MLIVHIEHRLLCFAKLLALYSACKGKKKTEEKEIYVNYFSLILFILVKNNVYNSI